MAKPILGLVLHIEEGSEAGTDSWFHNPGAQASAHFGNPKTGPLDQWVDTDVKAWAEVAGNSRWVSVEHEGHSGDSLTPSQLENDAQLLAWLHQTEGVPLQVTDSVSTPGLGYHAMGGNAWGGHFDCPGRPIIAQRAQIIARAQQILGQSSGGFLMPLSDAEVTQLATDVHNTKVQMDQVTAQVANIQKAVHANEEMLVELLKANNLPVPTDG